MGSGRRARVVPGPYPGLSATSGSGSSWRLVPPVLSSWKQAWSPGTTGGRFEIGCGVTVDDGRTWSQRYKANLEKLASGDLVQVVEVVRDLTGREASCGLSAGEKRLLAKARLILLQEG